MERIIKKAESKEEAFKKTINAMKVQAMRSGALLMFQAFGIYLSRNEIATNKPIKQDEIFRIFDELANPKPKSNLIIPPSKIIKP